MNATLLEQLLYEDESSTLDFKRDQYKFNGGSDDDRSELLKDILGFANGWRRSDAYILIGVEEIRGGRSHVVGTTDHLADHTLQQFVNSRTNKPIQFGYEVCRVDGKQIGVISIDQQPRPFYLKKAYGKLEKDKVYVRRGSSTDPTQPATPEEIAQMGMAANASSPEAELKVEFAHAELDHIFGSEMPWVAEWCDVPKFEDIPRLSRRRSSDSFGIDFDAIQSVTSHEVLNEEFYHEMANYEFMKKLVRPVRLVVTNTGKVAANDVRAEIIVCKNEGLGLSEPHDIPERPKRRKSSFDVTSKIIRGIRPAALRSPGYVTINTNDERFKFTMECGDIQPGRKIFSDEFYFGVGESGEKTLTGHFFAANLPEPMEFTLTIQADITRTSMTVDELTKLADVHDDHDDDEYEEG